MPITLITDSSFQLLQLALDAASLRQQAIATNIANANANNNTTESQYLRVSFEEQLQNELTSSSANNPLSLTTLNRLRPEIEVDPTTNIAIDQQMIMLNQNYVQYHALLKLLNGKIELTNLALNDGKG